MSAVPDSRVVQVQQHQSRKTAGRLAGLTYLILIVSAAAGYMTMTRLLAGEPQIVLERLGASHGLFTLAFASMAIGFVAWVVLAFMLYRLMSSYGRAAGLLMLIFTVAGAAMNLFGVSPLLPLVGSSGSGLDAPVLAPIVESYNHRLLLAQVFSGLWMFPFGWLVVRSGIAPRLLGYCLMFGGLGYLLVFATAFAPSLEQTTAYRVISLIPAIPAMVGELGVCLWLLIKGAPEPT